MKTILVVDDEYALVESLTDLLQDDGYRVVSACNGKDGLARCEKERPDLVITDFMMPVANGRDLVRGMRAIADSETIPVIMMSATQRSVALSDEDGTIEVDVFLKKPFQLEKLVEAIASLIGPAST